MIRLSPSTHLLLIHSVNLSELAKTFLVVPTHSLHEHLVVLAHGFGKCIMVTTEQLLEHVEAHKQWRRNGNALPKLGREEEVDAREGV
jgi:hypothetical protein